MPGTGLAHMGWPMGQPWEGLFEPWAYLILPQASWAPRAGPGLLRIGLPRASLGGPYGYSKPHKHGAIQRDLALK